MQLYFFSGIVNKSVGENEAELELGVELDSAICSFQKKDATPHSEQIIPSILINTFFHILYANKDFISLTISTPLTPIHPKPLKE